MCSGESDDISMHPGESDEKSAASADDIVGNHPHACDIFVRLVSRAAAQPHCQEFLSRRMMSPCGVAGPGPVRGTPIPTDGAAVYRPRSSQVKVETGTTCASDPAARPAARPPPESRTDRSRLRLERPRQERAWIFLFLFNSIIRYLTGAAPPNRPLSPQPWTR